MEKEIKVWYNHKKSVKCRENRKGIALNYEFQTMYRYP